MSNAFRGGSHGGRRRVDAPLIKLVEQYLYDFKHLSFINLDHMGDVVKSKSFRYARMNQAVFKEQLRRAYEQYSETTHKSLEDFAGENIQFDDAPLTEETLRQMEGYPSEGDSDIEIEESANIAKDAGIDQMKNLYKTSSTNSNNVNSRQDNTVDGSGGASMESEKAPNESNLPNADRSDVISISSSTDLSLKADNSRAKSGPIVQEETIEDNNLVIDENESESDLEIIEEVPNERLINSVITNGCRKHLSITVIGRGGVEESQANFSGRNDPQNTSHSSTSTVGIGSVPPKITNAPSRGVKRKPTGSIENDAYAGINEDFSRKKPRKEVTVINDNGYKLQDFAGSDKVVEEVCKLLMHLKHPEVYQTLGVTPPRGFLLHGPPGTGKTLLANAIAGELQTPMLKIAGTELVSGISGESENNIRDLFSQAVAVAPCVVFIDEIDSVTPKRETVNKDMERRIVAQLLSCIDDLASKEKGNQVLLIGATNRIEAIDTALRRAGRFDREICLGIPDETSREKILNVICRGIKLEIDFNIKALAKLTPGYVGADLQALVREAAIQAVNRMLLLEKDVGSGAVDVAPASPATTKKNDENNCKETTKGTNIKNDENACKETTMDTNTKNDENACKETTMDTNTKNDENACKETTKDTNTKNGENEDAADVETSSAMEIDGQLGTDTTPTPDEENLNKNSHDITIKNQGLATETLPIVAEDQVLNPLRWIKESSPLSAEKLQDLFVTMLDFTFALKNVQPSSKREGFATVPDTTWEDIGALHNIRDELQVSILGPVKHLEAFKQLGLTTPAGVLLCGPPGCGKTLLAKAVANEAGINFISVKGPELLNMYVGESERAVRQCFLRARNSSPCVIFFDELDALCPRRSDVADNGSSGRIVNQLLTEMDGMEGRQGVFIMAASNRPDIIDPAVLRPGRLDKVLFVNLPTAGDRFEILKTVTKMSTKPALADDVNLEELANRPECSDYTGADLAALVREAAIASFREQVLQKKSSDADSSATNELKVHRRHFDIAFTKTKPSVGKDELAKYNRMAEKYCTIR